MRVSRWWHALGWMGVGAGALAAAVAGRNALQRPAKPFAAGCAVLKVDLPWTPLDGAAEPLSEVRLRMDYSRRTQAELLRSPNVLSAAVANLQGEDRTLLAGKPDPIEWLGAAIRVELVPETSLLTVSMPGEARKRQAVIVNAVVQEFLTQSELWNSGARKSQIFQADSSLTNYRKELVIKRRALREGITDPERQAELRDEIGVLEEVARRSALVAERLRLEQDGPGSVRLISTARP